MNKEEIKNILIIRYRFIGDTVLTTPFIKNVKENFPNAQVDILVSPNSGELIEGNPNINKIIYLNTTDFHKYEVKSTELKARKAEVYYSLIGCAIALKKNNYDLAFVLKRSFSSALLSFFIGAKYRVGFNTEFRSFLLTTSVKYEKNLQESENFLNCLKPFQVKPKNYLPEIFPSEQEKIKAQELTSRLTKFKPKISIHATSAHPYKQWSKRYVAKLIDSLYEEYDAEFVFMGAMIDKGFYEEALKKGKHGKKIKYLNLCGMTTLRECFAIYQNLDLAICVDSGNAHIAAASGIPTFVLYGPTRPEKWIPLGKNVKPVLLSQSIPCQPCDLKISCSHITCMKLLTPEFVLKNLKGKENLLIK